MKTARTAKIIDGKKISSAILADLKVDIEELTRSGITPGLAVVLVGSDPASQVYVNAKRKTCNEIGVASFYHEMLENCTEKRLLGLIEELNADPKVHGILVQMPLPKHISEKRVLEARELSFADSAGSP